MSGPSTLNTVRAASCGGPGRVPHRRMVRGREHEAEAELVDRLSDPLRRLLEPKPSASSTSAEPEADETARFPCLATPAPAAAATIAAAVEMLIVRAVAAGAGGVDEVVAAGCTGRTCSRIASAHPAISSAVSPLSRSATRKPPICRRRVAAHDLAHHLTAARAAELLAVEQVGERRWITAAQEVPAVGRAASAPTRDGTGHLRSAARDGGRPSPRRRPARGHLELVRDVSAASEW